MESDGSIEDDYGEEGEEELDEEEMLRLKAAGYDFGVEGDDDDEEGEDEFDDDDFDDEEAEDGLDEEYDDEDDEDEEEPAHKRSKK